MKNLSIYLQGKGFAIESVEYVGSSEMIFSLHKLPPMSSTVPAQPIRSALRTEHAA